MEAVWVRALVAGTLGAVAERATAVSMVLGSVLMRGAAVV
jgi:hypothetical protein